MNMCMRPHWHAQDLPPGTCMGYLLGLYFYPELRVRAALHRCVRQAQVLWLHGVFWARFLANQGR